MIYNPIRRRRESWIFPCQEKVLLRLGTCQCFYFICCFTEILPLSVVLFPIPRNWFQEGNKLSILITLSEILQGAHCHIREKYFFIVCMNSLRNFYWRVWIFFCSPNSSYIQKHVAWTTGGCSWKRWWVCALVWNIVEKWVCNKF